MSNSPYGHHGQQYAVPAYYYVQQMPARGAGHTLAKIIMWVAGLAIGLPALMLLAFLIASPFLYAAGR